MTQRHSRPGWHRMILLMSAAGLALAGAVAFARWFEGQWEGDPYPVADPAATARRLDAHTQSVYDALGLEHARLAADWLGAGPQTEGYSCHRRGLRHFSDALADSPASEPHTVEVSDDWALKGVSRVQAVAAVQRVRIGLARQGWKVTDYEDTGYHLQLRLSPPGSDDIVSVETFPGDRLQVAAYAACARYPAGTPTDQGHQPVLPVPAAPTRLRG